MDRKAMLQGFVAHTMAAYWTLFTGGVRAVNPERVPRKGPVIVAPTHLSFFDPPLVAWTSRRFLYYMAKEEIFKVPFFGAFCAGMGAYPVKRGEGDTDSIRRSLALLEAGEGLCVFPEGTRGDGVTMLPIARGTGMLAKKSGAPVVPAAIVGSHIVLPPKGKKRGKALITVAYGEPFYYTDCAGANERETRENFTRELERRMLELSAAHGLPLKASGASSPTEAPSSPDSTS